MNKIQQRKNLGIPKKYVKIPKNWKGQRIYSGLSRKDSFRLESKCLRLVNENYQCICGLGEKTRHFPEIIKTDPKKLGIKMIWVGKSINKLAKRKGHHSIPNLEQQIKCILDNLKRSGVYHLDMPVNGKNLCVSDSGILGLIDFDIAVIVKGENIWPKTAMLQKRYKRYTADSYDNYISSRIYHVLGK